MTARGADIYCAVRMHRQAALQFGEPNEGQAVLPGLLGGGSLDEDYSAHLLCGVINPVRLELGQSSAIAT